MRSQQFLNDLFANKARSTGDEQAATRVKLGDRHLTIELHAQETYR